MGIVFKEEIKWAFPAVHVVSRSGRNVSFHDFALLVRSIQNITQIWLYSKGVQESECSVYLERTESM